MAADPSLDLPSWLPGWIQGVIATVAAVGVGWSAVKGYLKGYKEEAKREAAPPLMAIETASLADMAPMRAVAAELKVLTPVLVDLSGDIKRMLEMMETRERDAIRHDAFEAGIREGERRRLTDR